MFTVVQILMANIYTYFVTIIINHRKNKAWCRMAVIQQIKIYKMDGIKSTFNTFMIINLFINDCDNKDKVQ